MLRLVPLSPLLAALVLLPAGARERPPATPHAGEAIIELPAVQADPDAGPRIWHFSRGNTRLRVLGRLEPLPAKLVYNPHGIVAGFNPHAVWVGPRGARISGDVGFFGALGLWNTLRKARRAAPGQQLRDVLGPAEYAQWQALKLRYLGRNDDAEQMRPLAATVALWQAALRKHGLRPGLPGGGFSGEAGKAGMTLLPGSYAMRLEDPKQAIQQATLDPAEEARCLVGILRQLPPWLDNAQAAGEAWAAGDTERLAALLDHAPPPDNCMNALLARALQPRAGVDIEAETTRTWIESVEKAAAAYPVVYTSVPVQDLIHSRGLVQLLLERGFRPDETGAATADAAHAGPASAGRHGPD